MRGEDDGPTAEVAVALEQPRARLRSSRLPDLELEEAATDRVVGDAELERVRHTERQLQPTRVLHEGHLLMSIRVLVDLGLRRRALVVVVEERGRERVADAGLVGRLDAVQVGGRALETGDDPD